MLARIVTLIISAAVSCNVCLYMLYYGRLSGSQQLGLLVKLLSTAFECELIGAVLRQHVTPHDSEYYQLALQRTLLRSQRTSDALHTLTQSDNQSIIRAIIDQKLLIVIVRLTVSPVCLAM